MNRSNKKSSTNKTIYRNYSNKKPTKIFIDSSKNVTIKQDEKQTQNTQNNKLEKQKEELSLEDEKQKRDKIIHENNLKVIDILQKEFDKYEKENELILEEMKRLKEQEKELLEKYETIRDEIETGKDELEEMKEINSEKNREYLELSNLRQRYNHESSNRDNNNIRNNNRLTLGDFMDGLLNISRVRNESGMDNGPHLPLLFFSSRGNNDEGPPMTYQQIESLPSSNYPRNNNNNEKCTICQFDFCYNDVVTKLIKCNHIFHKNCLINRLNARQSSKCPTCKVSII